MDLLQSSGAAVAGSSQSCAGIIPVQGRSSPCTGKNADLGVIHVHPTKDRKCI